MRELIGGAAIVRGRLGHCRLLSGRRHSGAWARPCRDARLRGGDGRRHRDRPSAQDFVAEAGRGLSAQSVAATAGKWHDSRQSETLRGPPWNTARSPKAMPSPARSPRGDRRRSRQPASRASSATGPTTSSPASPRPTASRQPRKRPGWCSATSRSSAARSPARMSTTRPRRSTSSKDRCSPIAAPARAAPTSMR